MNPRSSVVYLLIIYQLIFALTVINGQRCVDNAGSLNHDGVNVAADVTYIFADQEYRIACEGTVIAWEFCYRVQESRIPVTFYPSIWVLTESNNTNTQKYTLVHSSAVTFTHMRVGNDSRDDFPCQTFNLSESDQFTAPAGSVVGLYTNRRGEHPNLLRTNKRISAFTTYQFNGNQSDVDIVDNIGFNIALRVHLGTVNIRCNNLSAPANGMISCGSGRVGVDYEGDTCSFTCNTGYELTGSGTRTCQNDGSWSGSDVTCGRVIPCPSLSDPENGDVTCPSNTSVFQDMCTYYCNRGYQLEGNRQIRCTADGTWSSEPVTCTILTCNDPEVEIANSQSVGVCDVTYGSSCSLSCSSGFSASGHDEHVCDDVNDEGNAIKWRSVGGSFSCIVVENGTSTDSDSGTRSTIPIVAGSVGGIAFFIILLISCAVILGIRYSHKKRSNSFDNNMDIELNSDSNIQINTNPSYSAVKQGKDQEDQYDYVLHNKVSLQDNSQNTIKMISNPSYGRVNEADYDITIQTNLNKICEDEGVDGYAETNIPDVHKVKGSVYDVATDDNVNINPNPAYELTSGGVKLEDNPSYNKIQHA